MGAKIALAIKALFLKFFVCASEEGKGNYIECVNFNKEDILIMVFGVVIILGFFLVYKSIKDNR